MTDVMNDTALLATCVAELHGIRAALEALASVQAPAPNIMRPMADWKKARDILESMGAEVVSEDRSGPTRAQYQGRIYVRRSAHDEDGDKSDAIWFSTVLGGNVKEGNVKWGRLLTFRDRKTDALPNGAKRLKVDAPEPDQPSQAQPDQKHAAPAPSPAPSPAQSAQTPAPASKPAQPARPASKRVWPGEYVQLVMRSGIVATGQGAADLLNKSKLSPRDTEEVLIRWLGKYRSAISDGNDPEQALFVADTVLPQVNREGGANGAR
jgi:hypothetical protein